MQSITKAPLEVQKAFIHVLTVIPGITRLSYDADCCWSFEYPDGTAPSFTGHDIDMDLLEQAADAQYNISVPVTYIV